MKRDERILDGCAQLIKNEILEKYPMCYMCFYFIKKL